MGGFRKLKSNLIGVTSAFICKQSAYILHAYEIKWHKNAFR